MLTSDLNMLLNSCTIHMQSGFNSAMISQDCFLQQHYTFEFCSMLLLLWYLIMHKCLVSAHKPAEAQSLRFSATTWIWGAWTDIRWMNMLNVHPWNPSGNTRGGLCRGLCQKYWLAEHPIFIYILHQEYDNDKCATSDWDEMRDAKEFSVTFILARWPKWFNF